VPLPPLATAADLAFYGYEDVPDEILDRASARVRRYTGQQITAGTSTVELARAPYRLPQRPVTSVESVTRPDDDEELEFTLKSAGVLKVSGRCGPIVVDYSHGFAVLSDELIELVCAIASRLAKTPDALSLGHRTEQAGGESITYGAEAYAAVGGLTPGEQEALDGLFPRLPSTAVLL
jgi:hypothetical protein